MVKTRLNIMLALRNISPVQLIEKTGVKKSVAYNLEERVGDIKAEELSKIVNGLNFNKEEICELVTGKHLPESTSTPDYQSEMLSQMKQMTAMIAMMVERIDKLSHKIEMLENIGSHTESHTEEVNSNQGRKNRVAQKIPEQ